ncbi:30S ribosomal protein S4 [Candidatus Vecturithrix granuli]|uniref:Small ribosomal subunit protein uS4 n=1 Tax=Vecturithrix granuli TaxID=1499967 RepID=A0A081C369_VECG1|nr:30S ribosomal protein S4 [Candidatus Vecturithrix granuli]
MARYTGPVCRLCRVEGTKLYLKGDRCHTEKCALERRNYAPGQHGQRRSKRSDYGLQLREKQKVKRMYGLLERQFRGYFAKAERQRGITGENLLGLLERRLDNVVYRLGLCHSRTQARQMVLHGHFLVDGKRVNIPSYLVKKEQKVQLREKSRTNKEIQESLKSSERRGVPKWMSLDAANFVGTILDLPKREDISEEIQEQLVVELYSK